MKENEWQNYWGGRQAKDAGEALVGSAETNVEKSTELAEFWNATLSDFPAHTKLVDLACGAGSVLRHAAALNMSDLTGVDISESAIALATSNIAGVKGVVSSVSETELPPNTFDLATSQFGFEYSNPVHAVAEIERILKKGARFIAITHLKGGAIAEECQRNADLMQSLIKTGYVKAATQVFKAAFAAEAAPSEQLKHKYDTAVKKLSRPQSAMETIARQHGGIAQHLITGTAQLFQRRRAYALQDVVGWLNGMTHEITTYRDRMRAMVGAALSERDIRELINGSSLSLETESPHQFDIGGAPSAWIIRATKHS